MIDAWVLYAKWPVLERHLHAASWLQAWIDVGRAARTIDVYARGLAEFLEQHDMDPVLARRPDVALYVRHLTHRPNRRTAPTNTLEPSASIGLSNATIQQRLVPVRLYFDFLVEEGVRESNPVGRGRYSRGNRRQAAVRWRPRPASWPPRPEPPRHRRRISNA